MLFTIKMDTHRRKGITTWTYHILILRNILYLSILSIFLFRKMTKKSLPIHKRKSEEFKLLKRPLHKFITYRQTHSGVLIINFGNSMHTGVYFENVEKWLIQTREKLARSSRQHTRGNSLAFLFYQTSVYILKFIFHF